MTAQVELHLIHLVLKGLAFEHAGNCSEVLAAESHWELAAPLLMDCSDLTDRFPQKTRLLPVELEGS